MSYEPTGRYAANRINADFEWGLFRDEDAVVLVARGMTRQDAERAALCMNAHDKLLETLESAATALENILVEHGESMTEGNRIGRAHLGGDAQILIEKLKGETGD